MSFKPFYSISLHLFFVLLNEEKKMKKHKEKIENKDVRSN